MWECPDVFKINDQFFMIFSPENTDQPPKPNLSLIHILSPTTGVKGSHSATLSYKGGSYYCLAADPSIPFGTIIKITNHNLGIESTAYGIIVDRVSTAASRIVVFSLCILIPSCNNLSVTDFKYSTHFPHKSVNPSVEPHSSTLDISPFFSLLLPKPFSNWRNHSKHLSFQTIFCIITLVIR